MDGYDLELPCRICANNVVYLMVIAIWSWKRVVEILMSWTCIFCAGEELLSLHLLFAMLWLPSFQDMWVEDSTLVMMVNVLWSLPVLGFLAGHCMKFQYHRSWCERQCVHWTLYEWGVGFRTNCVISYMFVVNLQASTGSSQCFSLHLCSHSSALELDFFWISLLSTTTPWQLFPLAQW